MPNDVTVRARRTVDRHLKSWLFGASVDALTIRLGSPSEAAVAAHRTVVENWVHAWQASRLDVRWEERRWASLGRQLLPVAVTIEGADAIVAAAGETRRWQSLLQRCARLRALDDEPQWPALLSETFRYWNSLADNDFDRLLATVRWLRQNPNSGLLIRQLPIPGVDTKWLGTHRTAVTALAVPLGVPEHLGLRERELLRAVVIADPALRQGLPRIFAAPDRELAGLDLAASQVVVVENLQTLEALPDVPGTVAVFGWGDHATGVAGFPWVRNAPRVVYWGDLDTDGFDILARFRAECPCESLLMDHASLERWHDLAVPHAASGSVDVAWLTETERAALDVLQRNGLRLEQERIPIGAAVELLMAAGSVRPR
ncbi:hypothetical protein MTY66_39160 [Mycolicibacterium sp. TY66]|nr:hypothetical protein MTY66_39160 [Mycolicibacterium sp. TY66]BCJ80063.1 hypothetical protein MTY81_14360 [Mycolicibacterium sp. TY81]